MEIDRNSRRRLRLQTTSFVFLFLAVVGVAAWLSTRYVFEADWTASGRHTLAEASVALLESLDRPVHITAFARDTAAGGMRERIERLLARYRRHKADIEVEYVDPDLAPQRVREMDVTLDGELVIEYAGRRENLKNLGEQALTNALQRLARGAERKLVFLAGHGERDAHGDADFDLGEWVRRLTDQGFVVDTLRLAEQPTIPQDTAALVIADPQAPYLDGEVTRIRDYLEAGGNLLWLTESDTPASLAPLAGQLGIELQPGTIVDATGQLLGIEHPALVVVAQYPEHPVTEGLSTLTLFPFARPLGGADAGWERQTLLRTLPRAWAETGPLQGAVGYDEGADREGPLTIGLALTRNKGDSGEQEAGDAATQRVAVIGDADFLSNTYLGNGANAELGYRLANWLSHDDTFIHIPHRAAPDSRLELTPTLSAVLGFGFLLVLPGLLIGTGIGIWWRRRRH